MMMKKFKFCKRRERRRKKKKKKKKKKRVSIKPKYGRRNNINKNTPPPKNDPTIKLTPLCALSRLIQRADGVRDFIRIARKHALAKLVPSPMTALRRVPFGRLQKRFGLLHLSGAAQQLQQLVQSTKIVGPRLQKLLKVKDCRLELALLKHHVGEHHRGLLVVRVDARQRHAVLATLVEVPAAEVQLCQGN